MDQKYLHMTTGTPTAFSDVAAACLQQGGSPSSSELPFTYDYDQNIPTSAPSFSTLPTESIESLDCLLSVTNSNADTMEDDDGISAPDITTEHKTGNMQQKSKMILSTTSITSQEPLSRTVSSAASSESADAQTRQEREESVSQGSSDPQQPNKESKGALAGFKTTSNKRLRDHHNSHHVDHDDEGNCTPGKPKPKPKTKTRTTKDKHAEKQSSYSSCHSLEFGQAHLCTEPDAEAIASMREMIYRAAAFRPINLGMEVLEKPKRKNVRISSDPQTVAARQRRERISHRIRILQRLVPGGTKMDTASMLDEAVNYLKFLKMQVKALESLGNKLDNMNSTMMQTFSTSSNILT